MMQGKVARTSFTGKRTCFISIPYEWTTSLPRNKLLVLEVQWESGCLYTTWQGDITTDANGDATAVVELNGLFASKHGLQDGKEVAVIPVSNVANCVRILVEPVTPEDWEILEIHAEFIEGHLMDQVRVVWSGEVMPIWVHKSTCIFVRIGEIEPSENCVLLVPDTEVVVSPNVRAESTPQSQKPTSSDQSASSKLGQGSLGRYLSVEDDLNSLETDPAADDQDASSDIFDDDEKTPKDVIFGVFNKVLGTAQKIWWGMEDFSTIQKGKPVPKKITYLPEHEILLFTFDTSLRVQNLPEIHEKVRKSKSHPGVHIANQPSIIYMNLETFLQVAHRQNGHGLTFPIPCSFFAAIKFLPSPKHREELLKAKMAKIKSAEKKSIDSVQEENPQCIVRVVVVDENWSFSVRNSNKDRITKVSFRPHSILNGHIAVPDLLRQQLGLDVTGRVRIKALGDYKPAHVQGIMISPLSTMPGGMTVDVMKMAFQAWLATSTASCLPLVTASGTVLRFFITQDYFAEFLVTFLQKKSAAVKVLDYFLLSESNLKDLKVKYDLLKMTEMTKPPTVPRLPKFDLESLDPQVPSVDLSKLGGVDCIVDEALAHLMTCLKMTPLSHVFMGQTPGLRGGGGLLICGPRGVGKSAIGKGLCRRLAMYPTLANVQVVDCKPLRGKKPDSFKRHLEKILLELSWRQPGILLLNDLDLVAAAPSGPEQEASGEMHYFVKMAEAIKDLFMAEVRDQSNIVVIATAKSDNSVNDILLPTRGHHFFSKIIDIKPPNKTDREKVLRRMVENRPGVDPECADGLDLGSVASRSEGYVGRDLDLVISRAIHAHKMMEKSNDGVIYLTDQDMNIALDGFTPAALRGVNLHKAGDLGWDDVGGLIEVRNTLVETLQWPSKYPHLFSNCPLRLRSGILLYGAPGTGKTLLAGVVAKECGLNFISIKGPELLNKYIGASEQAVRDTFARAQSAKPCILFFDEFDSLAPRRGHDSTGVTDRVVNQFLTQLDGVEGLDGVYVLAATSRPDLIDPALLRPGRLDKAIFCPLPDKDERVQILKALTRSMALVEDVDLDVLSKSCNFFSGADLKALLYNAQLEAIHEHTAMMQRSSLSRESTPIVHPDLGSYEVIPPKPLASELTEAETSDVVKKSQEKTLDWEAQTSQALNRALSLHEDHFDHNTPEGSTSSLTPGGSTNKGLKVMERTRSSKVVYMPRLQDGQVDLDAMETENLKKQVTKLHGKHLEESQGKTSGPKTTVIRIHMHHLETAARNMSPSVSTSERSRYKSIYERFVNSRGGDFSQTMTPGEKRATLA